MFKKDISYEKLKNYYDEWHSTIALSNNDNPVPPIKTSFIRLMIDDNQKRCLEAYVPRGFICLDIGGKSP